MINRYSLTSKISRYHGNICRKYYMIVSLYEISCVDDCPPNTLLIQNHCVVINKKCEIINDQR